jgi:hypothetical protein
MKICSLTNENKVLVIGVNELRKMAQEFIEISKLFGSPKESKKYMKGYEGGILDFINGGLGIDGEDNKN